MTCNCSSLRDSPAIRFGLSEVAICVSRPLLPRLFQKISIQQQRTTDAENPLDLSFLAEAMLFYGSVEVVTNRVSLRQLIREIGAEVLLEFIDRGYVELKVERNFTGVITKNTGTPTEAHAPTVFQIERQELLDVLRPVVIASLGREGRGRRLALRFLSRISNAPIDEQLATRFGADLTTPGYLEESARLALQLALPGTPIPDGLRFEALPLGDNHFRIETNLNFDALNDAYHRRVSAAHSSLSSAHLLGQLLQARKILEDAARNEVELAVASDYAALIGLRISSALRQRARSAKEIETFQDLIFDDGRTLGAVFASKERTFRDLLPILDQASKFRAWLREREVTSTLVRDYFRAVTEKSWIDKLPSKILRWSVFTGAGLALDATGAGGIGTAGGIMISVADAFFVERILRGWRPNQFVEESLKDFVR